MHTHRPYADPGAELELAGHAEHASVPPSEYSPAAHALHAPAPAPDTVPAGHHLQVDAFVALSAADAVPLEHRVHVSLSPPYGASSNVPTGQAWHPSALSDAKNPAPHDAHEFAPVLAALPGSHLMQAKAPAPE